VEKFTYVLFPLKKTWSYFNALAYGVIVAHRKKKQPLSPVLDTRSLLLLRNAGKHTYTVQFF